MDAPRARVPVRALCPAPAGSSLWALRSPESLSPQCTRQTIVATSIETVFESEQLFPLWCAFWRPPLRRVLALPRWPYYKGKRRILARRSQGKVSLLLSFTRRAFLQSLSRSAIVLPLEKVLALVLPKKSSPALASQSATSPQTAAVTRPADLGVSFLNIARESGLNAKTIFGGEHKNKYLLETTGCG